MKTKLTFYALVCVFSASCNRIGPNVVDGIFDPNGSLVGNSAIAYTPGTHSFGTLASGATATPVTVTVKNQSSRHVLVQSIAATTDFSVVSDNCPRSPTVFASQATCQMTVTFVPTHAGLTTGAVAMTYSLESFPSYSYSSQFTVSGTVASALVFAGVDSVSPIGVTTAQVNWTPISGALYYVVYRITGGVPIMVSMELPGASSRMVSGLTAATDYTFNVQAVDSQGLEDGNTNNVTITTFPTTAAPLISIPTDRTYPNALAPTDTLSQSFYNLRTGDNTGMSYTCLFDRVVDGSASSGTACTSLPGLATATFNTSTGTLTWTPNNLGWGTYEFEVTGTNAYGSSTRVWVVSVKFSYSQTALRGDWVAMFASGTIPYAGANNSWRDLTTNGYHGTNSDTVNASWVGDGSVATPYALSYNGLGYTDFGTSALSGQTRVMLTQWATPSSASTGGTVLLGNSRNGAGTGLTLRQSKALAGKVEAVAGRTHQDTVLGYSPVAYWRLSESSGTVASDISGNGYHGTYGGGITLGAAGALTNDSDTVPSFDGANDRVQIADGNAFTFGTSTFSISAWVRFNNIAGANERILVGKMEYVGNQREWALVKCGTNVDSHCLTPNTLTFMASSSLSDGLQLSSISSSTIVASATWYHVVATSNAGAATIYLNGVSNASGTIAATMANGTAPVYLGMMFDPANIGALSGNLDEVAIFNTALTPAQVTALYQSGLGTYGSTCTTSSTIVNNEWNFFSLLFDGATTTLGVNGRTECSVTTTPGLITPTSSLVSAATDLGTSIWSGRVADIKAYATSDGSAAGSVTAAKAVFDATADPVRKQPVGGIVQDSLVLHMDPSNAARGVAPYTNGCAAADLSWFDLSSSALTGTLTNFAACGASSGWTGTGVPASPYALTLDGTNDYVSFGTPSALAFERTNTFSIDMWMATSAATQTPLFLKLLSVAPYTGYLFQTEPTGQLSFDLINNWTGNALQVISTTTVNNGAWHHVAVTYDGSSLASGANLYIDGAPISVTVPYNTLSGSILNASAVQIGNSAALYLNGKVGATRVYNKTLTPAEISQNCKAQVSRYNGGVCL